MIHDYYEEELGADPVERLRKLAETMRCEGLDKRTDDGANLSSRRVGKRLCWLADIISAAADDIDEERREMAKLKTRLERAEKERT